VIPRSGATRRLAVATLASVLLAAGHYSLWTFGDPGMAFGLLRLGALVLVLCVQLLRATTMTTWWRRLAAVAVAPAAFVVTNLGLRAVPCLEPPPMGCLSHVVVYPGQLVAGVALLAACLFADLHLESES